AHGPLRWTNLALDIFLKSSGHGIPVTINGEPMAGVIGPVTHAGAAAVGNAEILAGIVVNQVLEPGRPVIYNLGLAHVFDMKAGTAVTGGPENPFYAEVSASLGRFYNIPSSSWVSTESVFEDEQAAFEKMFAIHTHMLGGVSLIWGLGQLESEMSTSLGQLVMDNEMVNYTRHYQRGFEINDEELQFDLIRETGIGGNYLDKDHTFENFRRTLYDPSILNRKARASCPGPLPEVALAKAQEIIKSDSSEKIKSAELQELKRIETHFRQ
ncbi:MAG: trimethylamine methyltransferase family protein, partial [Lentisphaerota bacterium]